MNVKEVLVKAREFLSDASRWYKGGFYDDATASKFCMLGAIRLQCGYYEEQPEQSIWDSNVMVRHTKNLDNVFDVEKRSGLYHNAIVAVEQCLPDDANHDVALFNDRSETTHEQVLQVLDCAIAKVK